VATGSKGRNRPKVWLGRASAIPVIIISRLASEIVGRSAQTTTYSLLAMVVRWVGVNRGDETGCVMCSSPRLPPRRDLREYVCLHRSVGLERERKKEIDMAVQAVVLFCF